MYVHICVTMAEQCTIIIITLHGCKTPESILSVKQIGNRLYVGGPLHYHYETTDHADMAGRIDVTNRPFRSSRRSERSIRSIIYIVHYNILLYRHWWYCTLYTNITLHTLCSTWHYISADNIRFYRPHSFTGDLVPTPLELSLHVASSL